MIATASKPETGQVRVLQLPIQSVHPSVENDQLYRPIDPNDPGIIALAESIQANGIKEPLIVTVDRYIISGHRWFVAAERAELTMVPCRIEPFNKCDDPDRFMRLLRECNLQRVKTLDEKLREELLSTNTEEAYESLIAHREAQSVVSVDTIELRETKHRCKISEAKQPMLDAVKAILTGRRLQGLLPVSVRKVHYLLLNDPPLKHASKPGSIYTNVKGDYKNLVDLLSRARLSGEIPWDAISDDTRPVVVWEVEQDVQAFMRKSFDSFLKGYWRDLLQSQPNHIEIVVENGTDVFEVEAMETADLQKILEGTIDSVIDTDAFNHEVSQEARNAAFLDATRRTVHSALSEMMLDDYNEEDMSMAD